jgi:hypothetical protein
MRSYRVHRHEHGPGDLVSRQQRGKVPKDLPLLLGERFKELAGRGPLATGIGLWVPSTRKRMDVIQRGRPEPGVLRGKLRVRAQQASDLRRGLSEGTSEPLRRGQPQGALERLPGPTLFTSL